MILVVAAGLLLSARGTATFVRESLAFRRADGRGLAGWPRAAFTGRFGPHSGHFDPGQRIANIIMVLTLLTLTPQRSGTALPSVGCARRRHAAHASLDQIRGLTPDLGDGVYAAEASVSGVVRMFS